MNFKKKLLNSIAISAIFATLTTSSFSSFEGKEKEENNEQHRVLRLTNNTVHDLSLDILKENGEMINDYVLLRGQTKDLVPEGMHGSFAIWGGSAPTLEDPRQHLNFLVFEDDPAERMIFLGLQNLDGSPILGAPGRPHLMFEVPGKGMVPSPYANNIRFPSYINLDKIQTVNFTDILTGSSGEGDDRRSEHMLRATGFKYTDMVKLAGKS